jgi:phosphatidylserine/phosphatidylglycerophosphate/cardiolipin synthase-like enzyme
MKKVSKLMLTNMALAILLSSCNADNISNTITSAQPVDEVRQISPQEVSTFASESAAQIASEQDKNKNDKITLAESALTPQEMAQIDKNNDGAITKAEIAENIQNKFYEATKVINALDKGSFISQQYEGSLPQGKPPVSTLKPAKTQLYIDRDEILPMVFEEIDKAQKTIQMDLFLLGGNIGLQVAEKIVNKAKAGVDIKLTFDPSLGFAGPTQKEVYKVVNYFKANNIDFRLYPLHLMPLQTDGIGKNKFQIDHQKMIVIDGATLITGGFNLFDIGVVNRDMMMKITGDTAKEASELLNYEWLLSDKYIGPKAPKEVYVVKADTGADSMTKIVKTAPFESTTKQNMIEMIDSAKQSVYVAVLEFSDPDITNALIRAYKRGVDVKVMMDRKDTNDKYAGGLPVPNGYPNILPARDLFKNLVPVRWYDSRFPGQELHMKICVVDGDKMIAGSTNFTRQAFTTFRETSIQVIGGTAPPKMVRTFMEDWVNHSTAIKKFTLGDKIKAKVVEFLDKKYYAWW